MPCELRFLKHLLNSYIFSRIKKERTTFLGSLKNSKKIKTHYEKALVCVVSVVCRVSYLIIFYKITLSLIDLAKKALQMTLKTL